MNRFIIVEIGSTNTKAYLYKDEKVENLSFKTIEFKNHYKKENKISEDDKKLLFEFIDNIKEENIFVFGTSIFRNLTLEQKEEWKKEFKTKTNLDFYIVMSDEENELTVYGAVANINYQGKIAVMIGGGGSTELSIVENGDTADMFPDLRTDYAVSDYNFMVNKTKELVNKPNNKADLIILAGGDYIYYYEELNYPVVKNKFYDSDLQPYCLDVETMHKLDRNFFYEISLEDVCKRTNNDAWWRGARGMRLCVKALVDILEVKYIIPTRISMVYGIVEKIKNNDLKF